MTKIQSHEPKTDQEIHDRHKEILAAIDRLGIEMRNAIRRVRYAASDLEGGR